MIGRVASARWAAFALYAAAASSALASIPTESGNFLNEIQRLKNLAFTSGSDLYVQPTQAQVNSFYTLALDVRAGNYNQAETEANALDYTLSDFTDTSTGRSYYELDENLTNGQQTLGWGSYFWNPSYTQDVLVEVPHTLSDENTEDLGARLMQDANSRGFLMAGADRDADGTGTADVAHLSSSIFLAVDQAWVGPSGTTTAYQMHAFDIDNHGTFPSDAQAVLSDGAGNVTQRLIALDTQFRSIGYPTYVYNTLSPTDPTNEEVNGSVDGNSLSGLGATTNVEGQYNRSIGGTFVHVEMSPTIRDSATNRAAAASAIAESMASIQAVSIKTWAGAVSDEWSVANNWSPNSVPTTTDAVLFDDSIQSPLPAAMTLTDYNMSIKYLTWNSNDSSTITNATATSNNDTLTLNGDGESNTTPLMELGLNATSNTVTFSRTHTSGTGATGALVLQLNASGPIAVDNAGATLVLNCQITQGSSAVTIEKTGDGTLVLTNSSTTGSNTFTGGMIFTDGVVSTNSFLATGPTPGSVMPGFYTFNGGTFEFTASSPSSAESINRGITVNSTGGNFDISLAATIVTMNGAVTGSGTLIKSGAGQLNLGDNASPFTGSFDIQNGLLGVSNAADLGPLPASPTVQVTLDGGALAWTPASTSTTFSSNRLIAITANNGGIDVINSGVSMTINGGIAGPGALTKTGLGILALSAGDTFTGGVIVAGGTLSIASGNALGTAPDSSAPATNLTLDSATTLLWTGTTASVALSSSRLVQLNGPATIDVQNTGVSLQIAGVISGTGPISATGAGELYLSGTNTFSGGVTVTGGSLAISQGDSLGAPPATAAVDLTLNNATLRWAGTGNATLSSTRQVAASNGATFSVPLGTTLTLDGSVTGSGSITKTDLGTLALAGGLGLTTVSIQQGTLRLAPAAAVATPLSSLTVGSGASLDITIGAVVLSNSSQLSTVRSLLVAAYDNGNWDLPGINTSTLTTASGQVGTIGYSDNHFGYTTFLGAPTNPGDVLIRYTLPGDANLDGMVNSADLALISSSGTDWSHGDFNYDGVVNADDYSLFMLGAAEGSINVPPAPEPALSAVMGGVVICTMRRRRNSHSAR